MPPEPAHHHPIDDLDAQLAGIVDDLAAEAERIVRSEEEGGPPMDGSEDEALNAAVADLLADGAPGSDDAPRTPAQVSEASTDAPPALAIGQGGVPPEREASEVDRTDDPDEDAAVEQSLASLTASLLSAAPGGEAEQTGTFEPIDAGGPSPVPPPTPAGAGAAPVVRPAAAVAGAVGGAGHRAAKAAAVVGRAAGPVVGAATQRGAKGLRVAGRAAAPAAAAALVAMSKPLEGRPKTWRDSIGYLAIGTLFLAVPTWFFVLVKRPEAPPPPADAAEVIAADAPAQ